MASFLDKLLGKKQESSLGDFGEKLFQEEKFDVRDIIDGIYYFLKKNIDMSLGSLSHDIEFLDKSILFEKFKNIYLEIRKRNIVDRSLPGHICVFDPDKEIMHWSVDIRH